MEQIWDRLDYYKMSTGSMLYVLGVMDKQLSGGIKNAALKKRVEAALKTNEKARKMNFDWDVQKHHVPVSRGKATELDNQIDHTISAIATQVSGWTALIGDSDQKKLATELLKGLFANGVFEITSARFEDEHSAVNEMLARLDGKYKDHVKKLALTPLVDQLKQLNDQFGKQLDILDGKTVAWSDVQAAQQAGRLAFIKVIFAVVGDYLDDDVTRTALLAPLEDQNDRVGRYLKRRGVIPQVDPTTGNPVEPTPAASTAKTTDNTQPATAT